MKWLRSFFGTQRAQERNAKQYYAELVAKARAPKLYAEYGIPDTLDGRFEAIIVHLLIEECRLDKTNKDRSEWLRLLHESFFEDMDRSLREGGVGDTGISKRVQRMASGFYGRLSHYRESLDDAAAFHAALKRNVYGTCIEQVTDAQVTALAGYVHDAINHA